jgi:ABC-type branched-subunit amino acid transport system permease subunit
MGAAMLSSGYTFLAADTNYSAGADRDAIDGFAAIAAALDQGIEDTAVHGGRIVDAVAIGLGWLVLAAIIFYPALQLAAIAICIAFICMRSLVRHVLASLGSSLGGSAGFSGTDERTFLAA